MKRLGVAGTILMCALVVSWAPTRSSMVAFGTTATNDPEAEELVGRWIETVGGMESYHRVTSSSFVLTTELYDAQTARLKRARPRYVAIKRTSSGLYSRIERWEGDDFIAQGYHPAGKWATLNGEPLAEGDKDYDEADYVGGDVHYWIGLPQKLTDPGVNLDYEGRDGDGRHTVRVTFGEGVGDHQDTWRYFFVDGRSSPVEVDYIEAGKTNVNRTRWEDIKSVDGFFYVGRRVHFNDDGAVTKVIRTSDLVLNPELLDRTFTTP